MESFELMADNCIKGNFNVDFEPYITVKTNHMNAVSVLVCYNQLAIVFYYNYLKKFDYELEISLDNLRKSFILKQEMNYRKQVHSNSFSAVLTHTNLVSKTGLILLENKIDFDNKCFYGKFTLGVLV